MKKLTLELVPAFQQRLKVVAARKNMRVPRYCQTVMDRVPRSEEASGVSGCFDRQAFERVVARRKELFGNNPFSGDSVDLIREAREIRDAEIKNWA